MNTQITTLPPVERAVAALSFDAVKAEVEKLATQYADITAISNKAGRDQAHGAAMALKAKRVEIQKRAKEVREDALAFQRAVIAKGDELAAIIEPEEKRLIALRDEWDEAREAEKRQAAEAEAKRKAWHEGQVAGIRGVVLKAGGASSAQIGELIAEVDLIKPSEELHAEYMPVVERAKAETLDKLRAMLAEAQAREAEQARIKAAQEAEAARIAAERAELARQREAQEARARAERAEIERQAAELRAQQEAIRKQQEDNEAEARRIERERAEANRKAAEEKARAELEEAARAESKRLAEERERQRAARENSPPSAEDVVSLVAGAYDISEQAALRWLSGMFGLKQAA